MDTPIYDFVTKYAVAGPLRLHMPGHKGMVHLGMEGRDITEIPGADVLYQADGIIAKSQENASRLFGTGKTLYSAEGSSLSIRAMVYLIALLASRAGKRPVIAAGRNAHKVFIHAAALLDVDVQWLYPAGDAGYTACEIPPEALDQWLCRAPEKPTAVYITSPDYLGNVADIAGLSRVCRAHNVVLMVDNAHGAYLQFLPESRHPMALGADICCDSAHKTLPVLTGGAYLHLAPHAPRLFFEAAERAMAMFASTSPSYLILQSLDLANRYLAEGYRQRLEAAAAAWGELGHRLVSAGYRMVGNEPMKLTLLTKPYGYTGPELARELEKKNIFCEFADPDHVVMMLSDRQEEVVQTRLEQALLSIPKREPVPGGPPALPRPEQIISPHQAIFLDSEEVDTRISAGRIMASACVSCPPAIPIVSCGERIDETAVAAMEYYGITRVQVILE